LQINSSSIYNRLTKQRLPLPLLLLILQATVVAATVVVVS
jgi:hypothetical protein